MAGRYFTSQGFYVVVDYQSMAGGPTDNVLDKDSFEASWLALVTKLLAAAPEAHGKLLLDLINEPDGCAALLLPSPGFIDRAGSDAHAHACSYGLTWEGSKGKPALGDYYLSLGDKLSAVCPSCILLLEGTGQSKFLGVDWCGAHTWAE